MKDNTQEQDPFAELAPPLPRRSVRAIVALLRERGGVYLATLVVRKIRLILHDIKIWCKIRIRRMRLNLVPFGLPTPPDAPTVSIVIPVHNQWGYTRRCLRSIQENVGRDVAYEVIVVDDASSDQTVTELPKVPGVRAVVNARNLGFIRSCNKGASEARGRHVCFLNNDTEVLEQWIESMLQMLDEDPTIGVVGSMLLYPNKKLQEAGGIIWRDGSGWNYGRHQRPEEPEYNYPRDVDYCSGASLLIRGDLLRELGGFSEEFLPAYYEDTDLCFAARRAGYRTVYQPLSRVIHHEGVSSGTSTESGVKKHQVTNRITFEAKWRETLVGHLENDPTRVEEAARRQRRRPTILIIDTYVPRHDRESGSLRLFQIIRIFQKLGYGIIYLPDNAHSEQPYARELLRMGVELLYWSLLQPDMRRQLVKRLSVIDLAWICRPELCEKYAWILRRGPGIPVIYDTIDLHFLRMKRLWEQEGGTDPAGEAAWRAMRDKEREMALAADATVVVTEDERQILASLGVTNGWVIPNIHAPYRGPLRGFQDRAGLLFIGGYNHIPNVDAVQWLCREIMPRLWRADPTLALTLLGSNPPPEVMALANDRVRVPGYIANVEPYFLENRVFVAPLRYGAGMKGKIGQSLLYGLPVVTTPVGAEGIGLTDGRDVLIADDPDSFAAATLRLYRDQALWETLAENGRAAVERFSPERVEGELRRLVEEMGARSSLVS